MAYIGRLDKGKNVHLVIRLFEEAAANDPDLELHIAGIGHLDTELRLQASRGPFADRIVFHGFKSQMWPVFTSL